MTIYYVYYHKHSTDCVFYIGKGTANRMHSIHTRNSHWRNTVALHKGFEGAKLVDGLPESAAFVYERFFIASCRYFDFKLVNKTDGGDAPPVFRGPHRQDSKEKMSASQKGIPKHSEESKEHLRMINTGPGNPQWGKKQSEESNQLRSIASSRYRHTQERKDKISKANKGITRPQFVCSIKCPCCGKMFNKGNFARHKAGSRYDPLKQHPIYL